MKKTTNGVAPMVTTSLVTPEDVRFTIGAALDAKAVLYPDFDWVGAAEFAGRLSLLLPRRVFAEFFGPYVRELIAEGAWGLVGAFIGGVIAGAPAGVVPVSDEVLDALSSSPVPRVQEAAEVLRERRDPTWV